MKEKLSKKTLWLGIMLFALNVILLLSLTLLMIEINLKSQSWQFLIDNPHKAIFIASSVVVLSIIIYGFLFFECRSLLNDLIKIIELFVLLDISVFLCFIFGKYININARPFAFFAIMCATLMGRRQALFCNIVFSLLLFVIDLNVNYQVVNPSLDIWQYCAGLLMSFVSGTLVVFFSHGVKTRLQSVLLVFLLLIPIELIIGVMDILFARASLEDVNFFLFAYGAMGAFFSIILFTVLSPVFELVFAELTVFRLREITSPSAKLLKKLKNEAPGTFNHSMVVAQLTEACAIAIGEDGELARAAAYYHDVGKLKNPQMFTENQTDYNVHNDLSPEVSVDIIRSHARDGAKLIKKAHLPEFLADVAVQHHGTLPIKYFYAKALKMTDGEISMANYSYAGPTPQSRIAAIIMIADAAEAASRSLSDRSPAKIEALVGSIIEERINLDQFAECNITMRDLTIITGTITQSLSGVYHSRVSYPKIKIGKRN